ncbi:hypothetical protein ACA910_002824 [Epithemia clementina (nom. ined.)]
MVMSKPYRRLALASEVVFVLIILALEHASAFNVPTTPQQVHGQWQSKPSITGTTNVISRRPYSTSIITLQSFRLFRRGSSGHTTPTEENNKVANDTAVDKDDSPIDTKSDKPAPADQTLSPLKTLSINGMSSSVDQSALPLDKSPEGVAKVNGQDLVRNVKKREKSKAAIGTRLRTLKDLVWVREALEDLTAAEFACTVESEYNTGSEKVEKRRKRAVDYEKLLTKLNKRIRDLGCDFTTDPNRDTSFTCSLTPGVGSAAQVYADEQRQALLERLIKTRKNLIEVIQGCKIDIDQDELRFELTLPELRVELPREPDDMNNTNGPKLYVREDGTVDWDGALQDQAALRKFGTAVWARINGREPEPVGVEPPTNGDSHSKAKEVMVQIAETTEIIEARNKLFNLRTELTQLEAQHTGLLNSAIGAGQAVANVNLATLDPELRSKIMGSSETLDKARELVSFQTLVYELERVYTYLAGELGNPAMKGYISLQDRLNIAEFGLLESQIEYFKLEVELGDSIDRDVLTVVQDQMNDFKRRLGIDYLITGLSFDREALMRWFAELLDKTKKTLAFYGKGCRLFWNDVVFTLSLITRAAQGYTLKPREVRTIRRTFKDVLTFIPFVIILLIPLSPVGHVLVFGAIQRFFPGFFPSCFTEQRQNLLQLYETAEYSEFTIDEDWKAKLSRLLEAFAFFVANSSRSIYLRLMQLSQSGIRKSDDTNQSSKK